MSNILVVSTRVSEELQYRLKTEHKLDVIPFLSEDEVFLETIKEVEIAILDCRQHSSIFLLKNRIEPERIIITVPFSLREVLRELKIEDADAFVVKETFIEKYSSVFSIIQNGHHFHDPALYPYLFSGEANPLSNREQQILQLVMEGMSSPEIAAHLNLTVHTINSHIAKTAKKLHTRTRTEAVVRALECGYL